MNQKQQMMEGLEKIGKVLDAYEKRKAWAYPAWVPQDQYEFHSDAGHGWLRVLRVELVRLYLENKISGYSYMNGPWAYLEEDCDAGLFLDATKLDRSKIVDVWDGNDSKIRGYQSYRLYEMGS